MVPTNHFPQMVHGARCANNKPMPVDKPLVSAIYDGKTISFARKVVLNPDKTKVLFG